MACGSGGSWQGTHIDKIFIGLIIKTLGKTLVESFEKQCPSSWFEFILQFEMKKKSTNLSLAKGINLDISYEMAEKYTEITGSNIEDVIQKTLTGASHLNLERLFLSLTWFWRSLVQSLKIARAINIFSWITNHSWHS